MPNTIISPNMNMPVPVVGVDPGEDWATNVNACLSVVDSHSHVPGQGVAINPGAIDINADLPFNNFNATTLRSTRFQPQGIPLADPTDLGCLYTSGVDLYYNDVNGNQIRMTQSGTVTGSTGTITGLPSGTASASYAAGTFTFQSATNTPAAMSLGPTRIAQQVAGGFGVTLSASASQASDYSLTFPVSLPSASSFLRSDTSGNLDTVVYTSGTYLPSYSAVGGLSINNSHPFVYTQIGNIVFVSGFLTIQFIAIGAVQITFSVSTPIASSAGARAGGGSFNPRNDAYISVGSVENIGNSLMEVSGFTTGSTGNTVPCGITFMYSIV